MPELALRARNAHPARVVTEHRFNGDCLGLIAQRCARAMGVDVVDRLGIELAVAERALHRPGGTRALGIRLRYVTAIGTRAVTQDLSINPRAALLGVFIFFEYQYARPFG